MMAVPVDQIVAVAAVFLSVSLLVGFGVWQFLAARSPERQRLRDVLPPLQGARTSTAASDAGAQSAGPDRQAGWLPKSVRDMSQLERRLANAGYRTPFAARAFFAAQYVLAVVISATILLWFGHTTLTAWAAVAFGAVIGYLLPSFFLDRQVIKRRHQIRNGLPDVLDLLIVCLEAGSSLDQAVMKATEELAIAYPALAEELRVLTTETRAGKPRLEAFRNFAQRTKVDDVRALVSMLTQTDRFGTSVGQALRTLADNMRTKRRQAAEEAANKVGVKLVFPLVLCLFPAFFIVVLGSPVLKLMRAFEHM
jgi:tight adherence protein C